MSRLLTKALSIIAISCAMHGPLSARTIETEEEARRHIIYAPSPGYPPEALKRRLTGSGVVIVDVDVKTGWVVGVSMQKSTGHAILDQAAVAAFSCWRFKPDTTEKQVEIPVTFVP